MVEGIALSPLNVFAVFLIAFCRSARQYVNGIVREYGKIQQKYTENCENPLYTEGFPMLYSRSCNVRTDAQIKSHVQRFRWMVPLRCEVGSG